jgi:hypothetical protein
MAGIIDPKVVTSGLVLAVDATDTNSYPRTGATWTDLTGIGNNGTLVNSPTFSGLNNGCILFNGTTQYVNIANSTSLQVADTFTVSSWVYTTTLAARYAIFSTRVNNTAGCWQLEIGSTGVGSLSTNRVAFTGVSVWLAETFDNVISTNRWFHICLTKVNNATVGGTIYINGVAVANRQTNAYTISNNTDAKRIATSTGLIELFPGYISQVTLYNRVLTATEVLQNYRATKTRFGLL